MVGNFLDSQRGYQFIAVIMDNICRGQKIGLAATILTAIRRRFITLTSEDSSRLETLSCMESRSGGNEVQSEKCIHEKL
jgi:hypothetical protein